MKSAVLPVLLAGLALLAGCALVPAAPSPAGGAPATTVAPPSAPGTAVTARPRLTTAAPTAPALTSTVVPATLAPTNTAAPATAAPTGSPTGPAAQPTVPPGFTTHRDPEAGFAIDYPAGWSLTVPPAEARRDAQAYTASIRSKSPESQAPRGQALPAGATGIDVTVYRTKATTFEEVVRERRDAISHSETEVKIVSEEPWTLPGGLPAVRWQLETAQAGTIAELVTYLGGKGVMVSGMGELAPFDAIARSLRPESAAPPAGAPATATLAQGAVRRYDDGSLGFSLTLPSGWELCQDTGWSRLFCLKQAAAGGPAFPRFFVTVLPSGFTNADASAYDFISEENVEAFMALPAGQARAVDALPAYSTFTRLPDTTVSGLPGVVIENGKVWEGGPNTRDRRVLVKVATSTYMLGTYYETAEQLAEFEQVLAGVRITAR